MTYASPTARIATPIGMIRLEQTGGRLMRVRIETDDGPEIAPETPLLGEAAAQLRAYFAGKLRAFDVPLASPATPRGGALRDAIVAVGHGETASYGQIARTIGSAPRAVGQACARNPFPIIVPCHRVLAAGQRLGPYSGGNGPETKAWLLDHERGHYVR